ncbi:hypothetical protein AKJ16_DCAP20707 [Drosera capensis]
MRGERVVGPKLTSPSYLSSTSSPVTMLSPHINPSKTLTLTLTVPKTPHFDLQFPFSLRRRSPYSISCSAAGATNGRKTVKAGPRRSGGGAGEGELKGEKESENVWSIDNRFAEEIEEMEERRGGRGRIGRTGRRRVRKGNGKGSRVLVSGTMLIELETVLQTQVEVRVMVPKGLERGVMDNEPVILPVWNTFASSVSGIWKGVGAVFSPTTAEMEPIDTGRNDEYLYDCYTYSRVEALPAQSSERTSQIRRLVNWVTLNPHGENKQQAGELSQMKLGSKHETASSTLKDKSKQSSVDDVLPSFESFNVKGDVMEEDVMEMEPGLVFFEDGSYSRGPVDIPVNEDGSNYYASPTFKFEQCLVKGCHKRLRIVHTIEFSDGGADIQILRVAVYEEQWVSPSNIEDPSEVEFDLKPFSQRKRIHPSELSGPWKVFEMSAIPIDGGDMKMEGRRGTPYVYLCMETLKKRSLPESSSYFREEDMLDMQDVTVLWLPGGVTAYVDIDKDGILCIGVGWYSDEGINLVMERDYETDGKLKEVRWKSEVKRRWPEPIVV